MTVPCTSCGESLDADDLRCPNCGTLAPPRWGASVFAGEPTDEPPTGWDDPTTFDEQPAAEPWAIPIRERADPARGGEEEPLKAVTWAVVAIAVVAGLVVLASQVLGSGGGDDVARGEQASDSEELAEDPTTTSEATTTSEETTTSTSSSTTSSSTTTSTTTTSPPATSGAVPTLGSSFRRGWVAQLSSVPVSAGSSSLESAWTRVRSAAPGTVAARSDEWPSLREGYWILVEPGPFSSENDVRSFCSSIGRPSDSCLPRMLSDRR